MNKCVCTCVALLVGVLNAVTHAQPAPESTAAAVAPDLRDRPEGLVHLDVMVTNSEGKPAAGLNSSDFHLLENGRDQKILSFQAFTGRGAGTEPPVKIILLVDSLDVPPEMARAEIIGVQAFLREDGGHLTRPTSVILLSKTGLWTVAHPSADGNMLAREIDHNELALLPSQMAGITPTMAQNMTLHLGPSRVSDMSGPQETALKTLAHIATQERQQPGRKLLLWVGPGWGIGTGAIGDAVRGSDLFGTVCWFSTLLREAHLAIYSFSVGETDPGSQLYKKFLTGATVPGRANLMDLSRKVLAVQSEGRVVDAGDESGSRLVNASKDIGNRVLDAGLNIEKEIESCVREAGPFYRISFDPFPAEHLNEFHDVKVEVDDPGLSARTNIGYYDQPYYSIDQIPPLKPLSLEELQKILERDESDAAKASQLVGCELTWRVSERRLASLYDIAHGKKTRAQLRILADASSFLDPPPDEILNDPPPGTGEQQHLLSMMSDYLVTAIHRLPDYFARRTTTRYQETALYLESETHYRPLHQTDSSTTTVRYRNGREDTDAKSHSLRLGSPELITLGIFGPALQDVVGSIRKNSRLEWVRWEQETAGRAAVFRASIRTDQSLRYVWGCCTPDGDGNQAYQRYAGYHIEFAIDPGSGAILRLSFQFDLKSTTPFTRSDIMIEYGPIEVGGKTYYCPLRSVSMNRARSVRMLSEWDKFFRSYGPYITMLNDVSFDRYHMFRSESHILTGFTPTEK